MSTNSLDKTLTQNAAAGFEGDRDSNGFFIVTEETTDFEVPDPSLDQAERISQALEIFDASVGGKIKSAYVVI
jgi:hypothetical protein